MRITTVLEAGNSLVISAVQSFYDLKQAIFNMELGQITEKDLSELQIAQKAKIESESFIGKELSGTVSKIAPIIKKIGDS